MYYDEDPEYYTESSLNNRIGKGSQLTGFMKNGEVNITTGSERINESIRDILSTPVGTRFMKPQYGCKISTLLFEPNDFIFKDLASDYIRQALDEWEPRIEVKTIEVDPDFDKVIISISYRVKDLGTEGSFVYTIDRKIPPMF